jgi:cell division protein FtsQ
VCGSCPSSAWWGSRYDRAAGEVHHRQAGGPVTSAPTTSPPTAEVDPKIHERLLSIRRDDRRRRIRVLAGLGILAGLVGLGWLVTRSPLLDIDHIRVVGAKHTPIGAVTGTTGLARGNPMTSLDERLVAGRLARLPWVDEATVKRDWPGTVVVTIRERRPLAASRGLGSTWMLVDPTGRSLELVEQPPENLLAFEGLPRASEPGAMLDDAARGVLAVARAVPHDRIPAIRVIALLADGTIELRLSPLVPGQQAPIVRFGPPERVEEKLVAVTTILDRVERSRMAVIDVRVPSAPVVTRRS